MTVNASYRAGSLGEAYAAGTEDLKNNMRTLFKLRPMSTWLHLTAELMSEEADSLRKRGKTKDARQLNVEAGAVRAAAHNTHHVRG